jgi:hypothetical protein
MNMTKYQTKHEKELVSILRTADNNGMLLAFAILTVAVTFGDEFFNKAKGITDAEQLKHVVNEFRERM